MINIALYGNNDKLLEEIEQKLSAGLRFTGNEFFSVNRVDFFQLSLFENQHDLFIIDITDNPEKGLAFAKDLKIDPTVEFLFVASSPSYAMSAFDLDALSYLLLPLDFKRLTQIVIRRFAPENRHDEKKFTFRTTSGVRVVPANRISYIEYKNHRMKVVLDTAEEIITSTMRLSFSDAAAEILADPRFVRSHASFIVNVSHIVEYGSSFITLKRPNEDRKIVPVSHAKHSTVKAHIMDYYKA